MSAIRLEERLRELSGRRLEGLHRLWLPEQNASDGDGLAALLEAMCDPARLARVVAELGPLERDLLAALVRSEDGVHTHEGLLERGRERAASGPAVEESLEKLGRRGLVFPVVDERWDRCGRACWAVGAELQAPLRRVLFGGGGRRCPLTLKEFLAARHFQDAGSDGGTRARHARQAYKLFLMPGAVLGRLKRLDPEDRALVETAITRFGGLLPRSLAARALDAETAGRLGPELGARLEEGLIGTYRELDLRQYGIELDEPTLVVFQEVTLVVLKARAEKEPPAPPREVVAGVDLATNVMRFLRFVDEEGVRFTVKGEVFKATQKRIEARLVIGEGGEDPARVFRFIYRFCLARRWIDRSGERRLRLSEQGRRFEDLDLPAKLRDLLAFAVDETELGGDPYHQIQLRRILLRLLRRLEPGRWYDAMYLPHLARNTYLAQLDALGVADWFAAARERGGYPTRGDLVQMSWHLFHWVRHRLHLLGIVDLGYDESGMPIALRLSPLGASLLAGKPAPAAEGARSTLVVNPDFEILLFPEADAFELVHTLDRFSKRLSSDRVFRFQISEESIRSALADGMALGEILRILGERCRTPLPQNVLFSIRDWGDRAGLLFLDGDGVIECRRSEVLDRLLENRRVRELCGERLGPCRLRLGERTTPEEFKILARDLGFHLEMGKPPLPRPRGERA